MKSFSLHIATPERLVLSQEVVSVSIPTKDGQITVLPGHIPLITNVVNGEIVAKTAHDVLPMGVLGGFAKITQDGVTILADFAEHVHEMSEDVVQKAQAKAAELAAMKETLSKEDFEHFEAELERSLMRVKVASKWKNMDAAVAKYNQSKQ
ncbi:ATP synthase F1 subunit epsilon [Candidatus Falkowbacteria bacterium]|nr:ATP synthase F1 subunit epsilon [Candidatus Falkowbacteria bacterium]